MTVEIRDVAPGLWLWRQEHPDWHPGAGWEGPVTSTCVESGGAIGRPFLVRSQCADQNDPDGFFVRFAPTSGGILLDMSVHDIDGARWLLGAGSATRAGHVRHLH